MNIQNFKDYQELALVTNTGRTDPAENFLHGAMGAFTEVGEILSTYKAYFFYNKVLDTVNINEEIGDALWFISLCFFALGKEMDINPEEDLKDLTPPGLHLTLGKLSHYSSVLSSMALSRADEVLEANLEYDLRNLTYFLYYLADMNGFKLLDIARNNIIKLKKRYPNGYNDYDATHRDKQNELSHIEVEK